jgi:hypothetical protein
MIHVSSRRARHLPKSTTVATISMTIAGTVLVAIITLWPTYLWGLRRLSADCASQFNLGGMLPVLPGPTPCGMSVGVLPFQLWASLSLIGGCLALLLMVRILRSSQGLLGADNGYTQAGLELRSRIRRSRKWIILTIVLLALSASYAVIMIRNYS